MDQKKIYMGLAVKTALSVGWNFIEQLLRRGLSIIVTLVLARYLTPHDYGLMGITLALVTIGNNFTDSGLKNAFIRLPEAGPRESNTLFFANLALAGLIYLIIIASSSLVSKFYNEPRLIELIIVTGFTIIINGFQIVQSGILSRAIDFKKQMQSTFPAAIISGMLAIAFAFMGYGIWALVIQTISFSLISTFLFWSNTKWTPRWIFDFKTFKSMYKFGYKLVIASLIESLVANIYIFAIGKFYGASAIGLYVFAGKLKDLLINQFVVSIQNVTYPALASFQSDFVKLKAGFRVVIQVSTFLLFPAILFLSATSELIFELFLTNQWKDAAIYLQLICLASLLYPIHSVNINILKILGRSDLVLKLQATKKIFVLLVLMVSIHFGVIGIILGDIISSVVTLAMNIHYSNKVLQYSAKEQFSDFFINLVLASALALTVWAAINYFPLHSTYSLPIAATFFLGVYWLLANILKLPGYLMMFAIINKVVKLR